MKALCMLLVLIIASCHSEEVIPDGEKIISIQHSENILGLNPKAKEWEEKIIYDNSGNIVKVIVQYSKLNTVVEYDKLNRVAHVFTFNSMTNNLLFHDSITYFNDSLNKDRIFSFSINAGEKIPLTFIYNYYYNMDGQVVRKETFSVYDNKNYSVEKFYWRDGNIERKEFFSYLFGEPNEFLAYEFFYEYDTKVNYKKNLPMYLNDPLSQTTNNITSEAFNDYYGDWEALCNPCITDYKYNASSLPYIVHASWGSRIEITYK